MNIQTSVMAMADRSRARLSLDGPWRFRLGEGNWRTIDVPGPWQAAFADLRESSGVATYARTFTVPQAWRDREIAIGFGAASYLAEVELNGTPIGSHEGSYLPFECVVPHGLMAEVNQIEVRVTLPDGDENAYPDFPFAEIPHGKQSWYGPLGGLWQSVHLEARDARHVTACRIRPNLRDGLMSAEVDLSRHVTGALSADVIGPDATVVATVDVPVDASSIQFSLAVPDVKPWAPDHPALYRLDLRLVVDEARVDALSKNFGFRTIEARDGRLLLNGNPIYLRGALDQDYYPEGICTPPSLEFLERQLVKAKALGLNCLRCHIKVPDPRYYDVADRLGMLVWTEIPNVETFTDRSAARLRSTMDGMLARDGNHPSIVIWTLINEDWGTRLREAPDQRAWLIETFDWLKALDPTRLVVDNSPCAINYHLKTDINDYHYYRVLPELRAEWDQITDEFAAGANWTHGPAETFKASGNEPLIVSEFGVWGLPRPADLRDATGAEPWWFDRGTSWGDGTAGPHGVEARFGTFRLDRVFGSFDAFVEATQWYQFANLKYQIESLRVRPSIGGYVVTELTDVHWEANGLMDLNRNLRRFHERFAEINADIVVVPELDRWAYWSGETFEPRLRVATGGRSIPNGCSIVWSLGEGLDGGRLSTPRVEAMGVGICPVLRITLPEFDAARMLDFHVRLVNASGLDIAVNRVSIAVHPRWNLSAARPSLATDDPTLALHLAGLGYEMADEQNADVFVTRRLDAARIERIRTGARVFLLAGSRTGALRDDPPAREPPTRPTFDERPGRPAQPYFSFPGIDLVQRHGTVWRGDWIGNFSWLRRDGPFAALPGGPLLDLTFDRVVPQALMTHLRPWEFDRRISAGVVVGWIHKPAATIIEKSFALGHLVATTFRLTEDEPGLDPTATVLLDALIVLAKTNPKGAC